MNSWPKTGVSSRFRPSRVRRGGEQERSESAAGPRGRNTERCGEVELAENVSAASGSGDGKQAADDGPKFFENVNS